MSRYICNGKLNLLIVVSNHIRTIRVHNGIAVAVAPVAVAPVAVVPVARIAVISDDHIAVICLAANNTFIV